MKRIPQKAAVTTLLYTMKPQANVKIVDVDHNIFAWTKNEDWESQEGLGEIYSVDDILHNFMNTKIANATVRGISVHSDMLILVIDTEDEEY